MTTDNMTSHLLWINWTSVHFGAKDFKFFKIYGMSVRTRGSASASISNIFNVVGAKSGRRLK